MKRVLFGIATWAFLTSFAFADLTGKFILVDTPKANHVTNDLVVTTNADWQAAELLVVLDPGSFFHEPTLGNATPGPPNPAAFNAFPELEWDTYVKGWKSLSDNLLDGFAAASAASDIGGTSPTFNNTKIDLLWLDTVISDVVTQPTSTIGRFTLSDTATGTWKLLLQNANPVQGGFEQFYAEGQIIGGVFVVPEPSAIILGCCGVAGVVAVAVRRRRSVTA